MAEWFNHWVVKREAWVLFKEPSLSNSKRDIFSLPYTKNGFYVAQTNLCLHTWQRFQPWKIIILTDGINSFQKLQNIPNSNFPTRISSNKKISSLKLQLLHIFNSIRMRLEMNTTLILPMPPYSNLPFFSYINPNIYLQQEHSSKKSSHIEFYLSTLF